MLHEGYSLDFVVDWPRRARLGSRWTAHFIDHEPNSATQLKRRQLRHLSWRLFSMPYWEWYEVDASSQQAKKYLASRLGGLAD